MNAPSQRTSWNPVLLRLWDERPRSRLVRFTAWMFGLGFCYSLFFAELNFFELFQSHRRANLTRFLSAEIVPFPLREVGFDYHVLLRWWMERWSLHGQEAMLSTACIAVLGISFAALFALPVVPFASRNLACPEPFADSSAQRGRAAFAFRMVILATRSLLVLARAVPDYILAFLLVSILGVSAWPAVLALALHNGSILGRLGADSVENLPRNPGSALRGLGATRSQLFTSYAWPQALPRFLLYFFYRFENCIRDATVLGMLGVVSLGYWIQDARVRLYYDDLLFYLVLCGLLVLLGDLSSTLARALVGRAVR